MLPGALRQRVLLQEKSVTSGAMGSTVVWKPVGSYYARVIPLDVRTVAQYQQLGTQVTHKVLLRGTVEVNLGEHRMVHGDRTYQVSATGKHENGATEIMVVET